MGAGQSAQSGRDADASQPAELKQSYYELLDVPRQATEDEIKKAYRRKALELHPDRNYGDTERATQLFAAVQTAYQVLSDPQERAWYDSHEEAILRDIDPTTAGGDDPTAYEHSVGLTTADDITRLLRKFHGGVEFTDAPSGFFGFLRDFFATLDREESSAALREDVDAPEYPSFGHKDDDYDDVVRTFYGVWASFSTCKTFAWRDRYRASDAEDRRMRRAIDKENARCRREAAAEFNDAVRALVAFVRKRDPRYTPNTQSEAQRQQALRDAAAAQAARMRAANAARLDATELPAWTRPRERDPLAEFEGEIEDEESSEEEHFECMACRKTFKSEKQWEAHEKSKKHQKAVAALRRKMQKEGVDLGVEEDDNDAGSEDAERDREIVDDGGSEVDQPTEADDQHDASDKASDDDDDDELTQQTDDLHIDAEPQTSESSGSSSDDEDANSTTATTATSHTATAAAAAASNESDSPPTPPPSAPKQGKAAQKRAKRAAAHASPADIACAACGSTFASKTRLFQHIKDHGHAAPVAAQNGKSAGSGGKKKRR